MEMQETMRQQVDVWVRLTYDADATLTAQQLEAQASDDIGRLLDADSAAKIELCQFHIERIAEEADIRDGLSDAQPDLLAKLSALLDCCDDFLEHGKERHHVALRNAMTDAYAAIAKATGAATVEGNP